MGKSSRGTASRVIGRLAGKSDDAVLGDDIDGGRFKKRLGIKLGFNAGGDGVVAGVSPADRTLGFARLASSRCELKQNCSHAPAEPSCWHPRR